jgi:hypothetical protein
MNKQSVENRILELVRFNMPEKTTIDNLYNYCSPHSQSLIERKARLLKEKGLIEIAEVGSHNKTTAYRATQETIKAEPKREVFKSFNQRLFALKPISG